jgi:hypothetical protein
MKPDRPYGLLTSPLQGWHVWWTAIRPRTLSIAATPVVLGSALAWAEGAPIHWPVLLATLALRAADPGGHQPAQRRG